MALSLTCACGARFEVEDTLAGQEIRCPECAQPLKAPALRQAPRRTSGFALASVVLALTGAFTILGTLAAIALGVVALVHVARNREQITGASFAVFGIAVGVVFTGLTLLAFSSNGLFGLSGLVNRAKLASRVQIDYPGPLEVEVPEKGFALTRPSKTWGVINLKGAATKTEDPILDALFHANPDLLLVQPERYAFVDVRREALDGVRTMDACQENFLQDLRADRRAARDPWSDPEVGPARVTGVVLRQSRKLEPDKGVERRELLVDLTVGRETWSFLVRLDKTPDGQLYVTRAYARKRDFRDAGLIKELRQALESFRILKEK
jgi:hypothetical protein